MKKKIALLPGDGIGPEVVTSCSRSPSRDSGSI